jgi:zinc protease
MIRVFAGLTVALLLALPARAAVEIAEVTSPGGIYAWLVEEPTIPFVALELEFRTGSQMDPDGKRGAVNLMTALLEEGAGDLDSRGFAEAAADLAASFRFRSSDEAISVSAQFLSENRDQAVALLRLALTEPRFDDDATERVRGQVLSSIRSDAVSQNARASEVFDALAFGDHPFGTSQNGTLESVAALTRDDLETAHRATLTLEHLHVSAVGDISAEDLGLLLDDLLAGLPADGPALPDRPEVGLTGGVTVVPFDAPQSVIAFGHAGIPRDDEDFFAAFLMNEILGGGRFGTRLMSQLREARGLTYGVGTGLSLREGAELIAGRFSTSNDRAAEAIDLVRREWARLTAEGVSRSELERVQTYLTGAYPLRFDGNATIARILVGMQADGLPIDYIETRNDKVMAVTLADITRVARRLLDAEELRFVVVGQPEGVEAVN